MCWKMKNHQYMECNLIRNYLNHSWIIDPNRHEWCENREDFLKDQHSGLRLVLVLLRTLTRCCCTFTIFTLTPPGVERTKQPREHVKFEKNSSFRGWCGLQIETHNYDKKCLSFLPPSFSLPSSCSLFLSLLLSFSFSFFLFLSFFLSRRGGCTPGYDTNSE